MTTAELIQKARDVGALSPNKEAVEVTITMPVHPTVHVTVFVDPTIEGAAQAALTEAIHAVDEPDLWKPA